MRSRAVAGVLLALPLLLAASRATAQSEPEFGIRALGAADGWRPALVAEHLLSDPVLLHALEAGLPLRFHLRIELWEKRLLDRLVDEQERFVAIEEDPIDGRYQLDTGRSDRSYATLAQAEAALSAALRPALRPSPAPGRFYYLASLQVETLSLSDLEELRRWLRGEAGPAVQGEGSTGRALESALRRMVVRVIGLPARSYEARSGTFRME